MPRCKDGSWCIDDLCHFTSVTLCGVWLDEDRDAEGEYLSGDPEEWGEEYEVEIR